MNKTLTIHIYLTELIHEIAKTSWQIGRSRKGMQQVSHAEDIQDIDEERILRSIQTALKDVRISLAEYIVEGATTADNILLSATRKAVAGENAITMTWGSGVTEQEEDNVITFVLRVPSNYANGQADSLATSTHSYIVNYSLSEWLLQTDPAEAGNYKQMAAEALQQLYAASFARIQPRRAHAPKNKKTLTNNEVRYE